MLKSLVLRVFAVSFFVLGCNTAVAQDKANYAYLGLEPEIVTNYISDSAQKLGYVRVSVELMIHDVDQLEIAEHHMPLLRSTAIEIFGQQPAEKVKSLTGREDIITGTLGKALGGASGGYTSGKKEVVEWLRQRSRPYLFSNSVAPPIVSASLKVFEMMKEGDELRANLWRNANHFRTRMEEAGFTLAGKDHAIIPVMLGDARLASEMADKMLEKGIYVIGFSYPVVPKGQARIRTQMSAGHSLEHVDKAVDAFIEVGRELGVIS